MAIPTGVSPQPPHGHPVAQPAAEATAVGTVDEERSGWLGDPETLLLVEDDAGDVVLVEELLVESGLQATMTWARSMAEARELLKHAATAFPSDLLTLPGHGFYWFLLQPPVQR